MSLKKQFPRYLMLLPLIGILTLSCEFLGVNLPIGEPIVTIIATFTATPQCGGDVTGTWTGQAFLGQDSVTYSMTLVQTGCDVAGTSQTAGNIPANVQGYVENGKFHFSESGSGNNCYWKGVLNLALSLNELWGQVSNCSQKQIDLFR